MVPVLGQVCTDYSKYTSTSGVWDSQHSSYTFATWQDRGPLAGEPAIHQHAEPVCGLSSLCAPRCMGHGGRLSDPVRLPQPGVLILHGLAAQLGAVLGGAPRPVLWAGSLRVGQPSWLGTLAALWTALGLGALQKLCCGWGSNAPGLMPVPLRSRLGRAGDADAVLRQAQSPHEHNLSTVCHTLCIMMLMQIHSSRAHATPMH